MCAKNVDEIDLRSHEVIHLRCRKNLATMGYLLSFNC
jgi:hypothetical protein